MNETVSKPNRMTEFETELKQLLDSVEILRRKVWNVRATNSARLSSAPTEVLCGFSADDGTDWNAVSSDYGDSLSWTDTLDEVKKRLEHLLKTRGR